MILVRPKERSLQPVRAMVKQNLHSKSGYKSSMCQNSAVLDPGFRFSSPPESTHRHNISR